MVDPLDPFGPLVDILQSASSLELRLALSAVVVVAAALAGWLVLPRLTRRGKRIGSRWLAAYGLGDRIAAVDERLPFELTIYYVVRGLQLCLAAATVLALLVVWGLTGFAVAALTVFLARLPDLIKVLFSVGLLVGAYVAVGLLEDFIDRVSEQSDRFDQHQGEIIYRVLQVTLLTSAGLVVLGLWDINLGGLLIGAGFLGIVVGMAARQTLGSLLAGFVLMFSKPFEVGDWIEVDGNEGVVTDITIVNTRLENFDGEYVVMPNDVISNSTIVNRTRKGRLRVRLEVGVDYSVAPERAEEIALDAITDLEEVMPVPRPKVVPKAFGDSAIVLELRFWIDKPSSRRRWRARAAVIRSVYDAFQEAGVKIPFPQRELSGRAETGGFRVAREADRPEAAPEDGADAGAEADADAAPEADADAGTEADPAEPPGE